MGQSTTDPLKAHGRSQETAERWASLTVFLIPLTLSSAFFVLVAVNRPNYLRDYRLNANPDALHYVVLGRNLLLNGHYSRLEQPPYHPDMIRTPLYPIFAGGLEILGKAGTIYAAQAILHAFSCLFLYKAVRRHLGGPAALAAALLLGTDLMLTVSDFEAMSEPLFIFWMTAALNFLLDAIAPGEPANLRTRRLLAAGVLMGSAVMTRPVGLHLVSLYCLLYLYFAFRERRLGAGLLQVALLAGLVAIPVSCWTARNYRVFSIPSFSYVPHINLTLYFAAGAYQVEHGVSAEEAQDMIVREFHLPTFIEVHNEWTANKPIKEIDDELKAAWPKAVSKYPRSLLIASLTSVVKASTSHNVGLTAELTGTRWKPPGLGDIIRLRSVAFRRLLENGPALTSVFAWQMLHTTVSLFFLIPGLVAAVRNRATRTIGITVGAFLVYFYLTVPLFGLDTFYRCRSSLLPFLDIFAGYGMVRSVGWLREWRLERAGRGGALTRA